MDQPGVAIIGAGAVGSVLARGLAEAGYRIEAVMSRTPARARALAERVGAPLASDRLDDLPHRVALVLCCVPDDTIHDIARTLVTAHTDWRGRVVAHTSGALTAGVLSPLAECGAATGSFHPLQTFTSDSATKAFAGIYFALEGSPGAIALGKQLARDLGARSVTLAPEAKAQYHLAASIASNFFVALMAVTGEVLSDAGIDRHEGAALLRPLVEGTLHNLKDRLPEEVLTGPIARGDRTTVAAHLETLDRHLPHLLSLYAALSVETVRVAVRSGRLHPDEAEALLSLLHAALGDALP